MKKIWESPKLIVLVRSHAEEAILSNCKGEPMVAGPNVTVTNCHQETACTACVSYGMS